MFSNKASRDGHNNVVESRLLETGCIRSSDNQRVFAWCNIYQPHTNCSILECIRMHWFGFRRKCGINSCQSHCRRRTRVLRKVCQPLRSHPDQLTEAVAEISRVTKRCRFLLNFCVQKFYILHDN